MKLVIELNISISSNNSKWNIERNTIASFQLYCNNKGINAGKVDGLIGPQTLYALDCIKQLKNTGKIKLWRNDSKHGYSNLSTKWPLYKDIESFYGKPGSSIVSLELPYFMYLAWDKSEIVRTISCHAKIAESLKRVFEQVKKAYSPKEIKDLGLDLFGGCIASPPRKMRGGKLLSTHSWGVAIDMHPDRNRLEWGRDKAVFARPEYAEFMDAFSNEGAVNLGEIKNYDWMHFQFVRP